LRHIADSIRNEENRKKPKVESEATAKPSKIGDDIAARLENLKGLLDKTSLQRRI